MQCIKRTCQSPANGHPLPSRWWAHTRLLILDIRFQGALTHASTTVKEATLLDGATALEADRARVAANAARNLLTLRTDAAAIPGPSGVVSTRGGGCQVWNVLRNWVAGADVGDADVRSFAGLAQSIVTRVKVFALLELVLQHILLVGSFTVQGIQTLLIGAQFANVDIILLKRIHDE